MLRKNLLSLIPAVALNEIRVQPLFLMKAFPYVSEILIVFGQISLLKWYLMPMILVSSLISLMHQKYFFILRLMMAIFTGIKFYEFRKFDLNSRCFLPAKKNLTALFAKLNRREFFSFN